MSDLLLTQPAAGDLPDYYLGYLKYCEGASDVMGELEAEGREVVERFLPLTPEQAAHRYAPEKWSVLQVLGHIIDTERVFQLRALWFARSDPQPLPGYDEAAWGGASNVDALAPAALLAEYATVRAASLTLFRNRGDAELARVGTASGREFKVSGLAWFLLGHERHHLHLLKERYGV